MSEKYYTSLDRDGATNNPGEELEEQAAAPAAITMDRRTFLQLMGGAVGAAVLAGCARPVEKIIPYLDQPPEMPPGVATWYATTCHGCSAGCGALVKVVDGRPITLEGNPEHPYPAAGAVPPARPPFAGCTTATAPEAQADQARRWDGMRSIKR